MKQNYQKRKFSVFSHCYESKRHNACKAPYLGKGNEISETYLKCVLQSFRHKNAKRIQIT